MIESVASERIYNKKSGCKEGTRIELKRSIAYSINDVVEAKLAADALHATAEVSRRRNLTDDESTHDHF